MRVEIHTLTDEGKPELVGTLILQGDKVVISPPGEAVLEHLIETTRIRHPGTGDWHTAHETPAEWLSSLHSHLRTPYLSASAPLE